jgi:protein disulfide-isomerase A6
LKHPQQHIKAKLEVQCDVNTPSVCSEKEQGFIAKVKALAQDAVASQLARLEGMRSGKMTAELRQWLVQRITILKQLAAPGQLKEEL